MDSILSEETKSLDLSFASIGDDPKAKANTKDILNLSFLEKQEEPKVKEINLEEKDIIQSEPSQEKGLFQSISDFVTGNDRKTESTEGKREFVSSAIESMIVDDPIKAAKVALGQLTTFSEEGKIKILKNNFPKLKFFEDEKGNIIVDGREEALGTGVLNQPGISLSDLEQAGFQIAAFTPAAKIATVGTGVLANAGKVGVFSAITQGLQDIVSQATGREEGISIGNIDKSDVAIAGGGGAFAQGLFQGMAQLFPIIRQAVNNAGVTNEVKTFIKDQAIKLGFKSDEITDEVVESIAKEATRSKNTDQAFALQGEKEFDIPLTQGQRTLDDAQLSLEDSFRSGTKGEKAQNIVRSFEKEQQIPAINKAKDEIEINLGDPNVTTQGQAGNAIKEGVQQAEANAKAIVDDAFSQVTDASLSPKSFTELLSATKKSIEGFDFIKSPKLAPATDELLSQINKLEKVFKGKAGKAVNVQLKPIHIKQIEQLRRTINSYAGASKEAADLRNISTMKRAFDDFMDDAVKNALFQGDDQAINALKQSRGLFREYAQKFRASNTKTKGGKNIQDKEGLFIEKIIADNPTDEQVTNAIFGASNLSNTSGAKMASKFKEILGEDSEGWKAIRQAALKRLIKTNTVNGDELVSGTKTLKAVNEAIDKNSSLLNEVFSKEEIGLLKRFAHQVKRTQPDLVKSRENPSGTAQAISKSFQDIIRRLGNAFAVSGEPALLVTSNGISRVKSFTSAGKAKASVKPFEDILPKPSLVSGSTSLMIEAAN